MSDFMKLFRRQKSVSKNEPNENVSANKNQKPSHEAAELNFSASNNSIDFSASRIDSSQQEGLSFIAEDKSDDGFKEPKGWRKSLRKLRWKKKGPGVSISSDNISQVPAMSTENISRVTPVTSPGRFNKRWSYSPDLCEENVPGAKELRGTLERKLSVKLEVSEETYDDELGRYSFRQAPNNRSHQNSLKLTRESNIEEDRYKQLPTIAGDEQGSVPSIPTSLNLPQALNQMSHLSQSEPVFRNQHEHLHLQNKGKSSPGLTEWAEGEFDRQRIKHNSPRPHDKAYGEGSYPYQSSHQQPTYVMLSRGDGSQMLSNVEQGYSAEETPEEEEEPYGLQDIDEVLTSAESRSATLRSLHGQNYDRVTLETPRSPEEDALHSVTGSLMRGRAGTQFERAAEIALENYNNYNQQPVDHYYQDVNEQNNTQPFNNAYSSDNELRNTDTDDDVYIDCGVNAETSQWDDQEFDSFSDDSDQETYEDYNSVQETKTEPPKTDRFSKDIGKLKFWERTSVKKKNSPSKSVGAEADPNVFLGVDLAAKHQVAQLPVLVPSNLDKNQLKRRNIVGSIISSEQAYIESLERLESDYKHALLDHKPQIIPSEMVEKIFFKIPSLLQCHRLFHVGLASATSNWDEHECIGGTFVASFSNAVVLECYGDFINNFTTAMDLVRKTCIRKPQFLAFLKERQVESPDRLNLYGLMLKPVQRFPQFIMFVQDLLKYTTPEHPDCLPLQLALTELETLAERLNHRKAEDEDAADLRNLVENSNLKLTSHTKDGRLRKLVKQAEVRECEHNEENLIEKMKDCLLVLTNDMLICCSINNRRPYQRSASATSKDMYKMKWRVGLDVVEVIDGSLRPSGIEERETLHADFIALQQISKLVGQLQMQHEGISTQVVEKCLTNIGTKIRQAEQLASQPENASFTVRFPGKSDIVTRTLVSTYASQKDEWLEAVTRAKLAHSPANIGAWFSADMTSTGSDWKSPLFLRSLSAHLSYETLQVQCAHAFMSAGHVTLLWLSCAASTVQSIVSVYYITEDRVEKVHVMQVDSSVECMQHWNPNNDPHSIWLGMGSASLLEYSTSNGMYRKMNDVPMPTMSSVMIMEAKNNHLYVGLLDGTLATYTRPTGTTDLYHVASIVVRTGPLKCLSPLGDKLWGCSGNSVVTIDVATFQEESSRSLVLEGEDLVVNLVTQIGNGLWVNFREECSLFLYHIDSLDRLQEMNLARAVRDFVQGLEPHEQISEHCYVTSLCSGHSQLFVGTSNGLMLIMPLPKLPGSVPKITGPIKISRHSLLGPLTFLFAPSLPLLHHSDVTEDEPEEVFDADSPPPLPERDDLDKTIVDETNEDNDQYINIREKAASPRGVSCPKSPPIPPRPGALPLNDVSSASCEKLPEDRTVYENMTLQSIESPRKLTFVHWRDDKKSRQCPVVVACGEGYQHFGAKSPTRESPTTQPNAPTIVCWKVV